MTCANTAAVSGGSSDGVAGAAAARTPFESSTMVTSAVSSEIVAPEALERTTVNVSSPSTILSLIIRTRTLRLVTPGPTVSVPDAASKSTPAVALPATVT